MFKLWQEISLEKHTYIQVQRCKKPARIAKVRFENIMVAVASNYFILYSLETDQLFSELQPPSVFY